MTNKVRLGSTESRSMWRDGQTDYRKVELKLLQGTVGAEKDLTITETLLQTLTKARKSEESQWVRRIDTLRLYLC